MMQTESGRAASEGLLRRSAPRQGAGFGGEVGYLGAHMSIAGGLHLACERGRELGCDVIQMFTKNQQQWRAKELTDGDVEAFRRARRETGMRAAFAHDTYLINLASPDVKLRRKSIDAFVEELERCERLALDFLVTHPGAHTGAGGKSGLRTFTKSLGATLRRTRGFRTRVLLETAAGQGSALGASFEEIRAMIDGAAEPERVGVCVDTCHVFAAGYDLRTRAAYDATMEQFDRAIGTKRIEAFHVNDSKKGLGCRVDRHENIGRGEIGLEGFRCLMKDRRFARVPKVLETPKENDMDAVNLRVLREMAC